LSRESGCQQLKILQFISGDSPLEYWQFCWASRNVAL